jgi:hypothetical protein
MSEITGSIQKSRKRFIGKAAAKKKQEEAQQVASIEDSKSVISIGTIRN